MTTGTKRCSKCLTIKPHNEFYAKPGTANGLRAGCKLCHNSRMKAWYYANPTKKRDYNLNKRYGLTKAAWNDLFEAQESRCIITQVGNPGASRGWATDHCHSDGFVRGILSQAANTAIGSLKDDPANFASAMIYLAVNGRGMAPDEWAQFCAVYSPLIQ